MEEKEMFILQQTLGKEQNAVFAKLMRSVYLWMVFALVITGLTAAYVANSPAYISALVNNPMLFYGVIIAELAVVFILSGRIHKMSFLTASLMFIFYSLLTGVSLSTIFLAYTESSIATTFLITAGTFGTMSLVGFVTKKDLSKLGGILFMALIGLIIATLVNIFLVSDTLGWIINYVGVLIFVGLTAYDTQKIKQMMREYGTDINEQTQKMALMGSLSLYLDFINMFLYLLRIFGNRD
ncbi:Bax inhibitor-1/YccA family protein [Bacteroides sp. OF04-15BH]|uniref:Bax inhibitor-1/YccA family protein n=1 Tax=Bacteroides sp. OF04-15BH TaxID=2292281 RepID=UPI000E4E79FF|nr:Bax inhibitor-1/YccA family protein [Bacteroides sp. OF04-15BH]RHP66923.1 BAX inhibitor (BI)-1/YccA family protein [Bacteroides sp. OF04-15BH]